MHRHKAFVSGSFIVQCILDEYSNSTIDIYVTHIGNDFNALENYLSNKLHCDNYLSHSYHCNTQIFSFKKNSKDIIHVRDFTPWCHKYDEDDYHNFVVGYRDTTKSNVQIISLNNDNLSYYQFVQKKFNVWYCDDKLYINNIEDILNVNCYKY